MKSKIYLSLLFIAALSIQYLFAGNSNTTQLWSEINSAQAKLKGEQLIATRQARYLTLDINAMRATLATAPMQGSEAAKTQSIILQVPMPDGSFNRFAIVESQVMHPLLAAKYPMIKTYSGQGLDDATASIRVDITQFGFHAMILSAIENVFIDPINLTATDTYLCYYKRDAINVHQAASCGFNPDDSFNRTSAEQTANDVKKNKSISGNSSNRSIGGTLRTYRLALACTGEYAATYGGTAIGAMAGMVTSVNRVVGVYEHEMDISMYLIANDDTLVFTNATTDGYTNNNGLTMLTENQTKINARIGSANYDIGHVFSTGGGGIAFLGCVCQSNNKARGVTGLPNPIGDGFDIDFVAHEMGHQFGGNHTFNSVLGGCNGNGNATTAYEPGSGITIMAYAGTCSSDDISAHSIANFHTASFDEIQNYITLSTGNTCPVTTATGNNAPVSTLTNYHYDIPLSTPFKLTGAGSDPDGDTITYSFEEFDLGPQGAWNAPTGNAPIWTSNSPQTNTWRLFPKLPNIRGNTNSAGDLKASYARTLHFRLTLRDNRTGGGGVAYDPQLVAVNVVNTVTPFAFTYPNTTGISWAAGSTQTVTWNVSSTDVAPISTSMVKISLSTTGGNVYPFPNLIADSVPNTGSYTFVVPNIITTTGRLLIEAVGNIFLDMNDKNFTITAPVGIQENNIAGESVNVYPNPAEEMVNVSLSGKLRGEVMIHLTDAVGKTIYTKQVSKNETGLVETINIENYSRGVYFVRLDTEEGSVLRKIVKL